MFACLTACVCVPFYRLKFVCGCGAGQVKCAGKLHRVRATTDPWVVLRLPSPQKGYSTDSINPRYEDNTVKYDVGLWNSGLRHCLHITPEAHIPLVIKAIRESVSVCVNFISVLFYK